MEGELDDISGSGQTEAAHSLCTGIVRREHHHLEAKGAGHYGIFSGRRWREVVYPHVCEFILRHPNGATPAPSGAKRRGTSAAAVKKARPAVSASTPSVTRKAATAKRGTAARKTSAASKPRTTRRA